MFCFLWCNMCLCQSIIYHCNVPPPNIMSSSHIYSLSYGYRDYSIYQIVKKNTRCKTTLFSYLTTESTRFHAFQNGRAPYTNGPMNLRLVPAITYVYSRMSTITSPRARECARNDTSFQWSPASFPILKVNEMLFWWKYFRIASTYLKEVRCYGIINLSWII